MAPLTSSRGCIRTFLYNFTIKATLYTIKGMLLAPAISHSRLPALLVSLFSLLPLVNVINEAQFLNPCLLQHILNFPDPTITRILACDV